MAKNNRQDNNRNNKKKNNKNRMEVAKELSPELCQKQNCKNNECR